MVNCIGAPQDTIFSLLENKDEMYAGQIGEKIKGTLSGMSPLFPELRHYNAIILSLRQHFGFPSD